MQIHRSSVAKIIAEGIQERYNPEKDLSPAISGTEEQLALAIKVLADRIFELEDEVEELRKLTGHEKIYLVSR